MLVDGEVGRVEDGDGVEDDCVDAGELLEDHDCQTQDERVPDLLRLQLGEEGQGRARRFRWNRMVDKWATRLVGLLENKTNLNFIKTILKFHFYYLGW